MSTQFQFPPRSSRGSVLGFTWGQVFLVVLGVICGVAALNVLAGKALASRYSEITNTPGTPASPNVPYSKVGGPLGPVLIPT